jgi:DNA-binding helix-hairpin-helix protein with protein kinase domain
MTVLTCAITGKSITLLKEIANSGEAKVWRTNQNGYLAKIYHSPTPERVQKLAVMIANPPTEPNSHLHHVSFAWPKSALKNGQGDCVGFLMPEIKDGKELLDVYNPRRRQALKLQIDWRFLHTTALNIVSIIEALHAAGYVLGDIKPQNILVNNRALPSIIDTDSFQVKNPKNGKVYNCLVGSEGYTPPELIGKDFDSIEQTEVHDRFRLGVIIYQLLFGGNNPFQGKWTGAGETPDINDFIRWGLWVNTSTSLIEAVARTIPLEIVHPEVQQCFLRCFNDGHKNPNFRPTARKWLEALKVGNDRLTICGRVDNHYYSRTYGKCYWCDRSTNLGVDIFPGVVKVKPSVNVENNRITDKIYPVSVVQNNLNKGKKDNINIFWFWLGVMSFLYTLLGLVIAVINSNNASSKSDELYTIFLFVSLVLSFLPNSFYKYIENKYIEISVVYIAILFPCYILISPIYILMLPYYYTNKYLSKSFTKWNQFLITFSTSSLGLFLGWLIYKISR